MLRLLCLAAALLLALTACASDESQTYDPVVDTTWETAPEASGADPLPDHGSVSVTDAASYTCTEGGFTVEPAGGGAVRLTLDGATQTLTPKADAVGVYEGDGLELWLADAGAFLVRDGEIALNDCVAATDA